MQCQRKQNEYEYSCHIIVLSTSMTCNHYLKELNYQIGTQAFTIVSITSYWDDCTFICEKKTCLNLSKKKTENWSQQTRSNFLSTLYILIRKDVFSMIVAIHASFIMYLYMKVNFWNSRQSWWCASAYILQFACVCLIITL